MPFTTAAASKYPETGIGALLVHESGGAVEMGPLLGEPDIETLSAAGNLTVILFELTVTLVVDELTSAPVLSVTLRIKLQFPTAVEVEIKNI